MTIHFEIPTWLLWAIGVPAGIGVLFLAVIGGMLMYAMSNWGR